MKNLIRLITVLAVSAMFAQCSNSSDKADSPKFIEITADVETTPVPAKQGDDAADDPAIWINKNNVEQSRIIGTNKKLGLHVYDLNGKELYTYPIGRVNNVDLIYDFNLGNSKVDIVVTSNRTYNSIAIFMIDSLSGKLIDITEDTLISGVSEVYGICFYHNIKLNKYYVYVNGTKGDIEQWELFSTESNKISGKPVRKLKVNTKPEGMVADHNQEIIYIGEEENCIWKIGANPEDGTKLTKLHNSGIENKMLKFDIEGLTIYKTGDTTGYLLASSQGNNSYAVYTIENSNKYLGSFKIVDGVLDGTEDTDGIDVTTYPVGKNYPKGFMVIQDGFNFDNSEEKTQNFKIVDWRKIETSMKLTSSHK